MNKRIKELIQQATRIVDGGPDMFSMPREIFDKEKFAQLIVAKCVAQCEFVAGQAEITNKGEMARKTKATANNCAFWIKEYFGVEQ
jgi:hypothetical protein